MSLTIFIIYGLALLFILLYSIAQLHLVILYLKNNRTNNKKLQGELIEKSNSQLPIVTIQLPTFNELYVVERLIDAVSQLDYPDEKLEIQMLDDSTDETTEIISNKIIEVKKVRPQLDIKLVRRKEKVGYKAGALKYGLTIAKGEFITIFDADFLPEKDFLKKTIPYFDNNPKLGVVQTRWKHINREYSFLTKLQAFGLDAHFTIEQVGRNTAGHFINFNGTAGIWRKSCIEDAGNWQPDTLTEDLDLSYRAQRKGWEFKYLESVGAPAELPASMNALKSQQYRWTKGAAENVRKNLGKTLSSKISLGTKFHSFFHLLNSTIFLCIMITALFSVPVLIIKNYNPLINEISKFGWLFLISLFSLSLFYLISYFRLRPFNVKNFLNFLLTFPMFLSMSMGLSLHNTIAVIEGYLGKKTPFIRTPKFNLKDNKDTWKNNKYKALKVHPLTILEGILAAYFISGIAIGIAYVDYGLLVFHGLLAFGFGAVFIFSFTHAQKGT